MARAYGRRGAMRGAVAVAALACILATGARAAPAAGPKPGPEPGPRSGPQWGPQSGAVKLLVLGDSLASGYGLPADQTFEAQLGEALKAHGYDVQIVDGAVSGDTAAGGLARLDWVLGDSPDAAIVELGSNDGLRGLDPAQMQSNLSAILDKLSARHIPVLLTGMYAPPNLGPEYERQFRAVFDTLGQRKGVIYDPFFLAGVARAPGLTQADGLHPNAAGVQRIVARILPLVEKLVTEARSA